MTDDDRLRSRAQRRAGSSKFIRDGFIRIDRAFPLPSRQPWAKYRRGWSKKAIAPNSALHIQGMSSLILPTIATLSVRSFPRMFMPGFAGSLATRSSSFAGLMSTARRLNWLLRPRTCPFDNSAIGSMRGRQIFIGGLDCRSITLAARRLRRTMGSHNISIGVSTGEDSSKSATSNRSGRRGINDFCRIAMFSAPARIAVRQTHAAISVRPAVGCSIPPT
jgi:hypothetical protein